MVYLLRHGEDDQSRIGGWSDAALTNDGINQVKDAANQIKLSNIKIDRILCSPIKRAVDSANIVSEILNIKDITIDNNLREQNKGLLNGMNREEADIKFPNDNVDDINYIYPEGESLYQFYNNFIKNINYYLELKDNVLIITHRGVINAFYYYLNNIELDCNKKQFNVTFASLHVIDDNKIYKIF